MVLRCSQLRNEAADRLDKQIKEKQLGKIATLKGLEEACAQYDAYERIRSEYDRKSKAKSAQDQNTKIPFDDPPQPSAAVAELMQHPDLLLIARLQHRGTLSGRFFTFIASVGATAVGFIYYLVTRSITVDRIKSVTSSSIKLSLRVREALRFVGGQKD